MSEPVETVQGLPPNVAAVLSGRADSSTLPSDPARSDGKATPAPEAAKAGAEPTDPNKPAAPAPVEGKPESQVPEVKAEDLEARLFGEETPEQKLAKLNRDYKASSKEAQRLKARDEKFAAMLAEQGLDIVEDDGVPVGLAPGKGYSKDAAAFKVDVKNLPDTVQQMASDDPQAFADYIVKAAQKALVRATPTVEKSVRPLSAERRELAVKEVAEMKEIDGEPSYPELRKNLPIIERFLKEKPALRDLFATDPEFALQVLNDRIDRVKARMTGFAAREQTRAQKKKDAAAAPETGPASGRTPTTGAPSSYADAVGSAIAKARY